LGRIEDSARGEDGRFVPAQNTEMEPKNTRLSPRPVRGGAYVLHLTVGRTVSLCAGAIGAITLSSGHYVYVGSARKSIEGRVARHRRLAYAKTGKLHWHIDYLLIHPKIDLIYEEAFAGYGECDIAQRIASLKGASVPVPRFGASDCRSGCGAHLFRVEESKKNKISPLLIQRKRGKL
jgi:Uri superfamily endonuclease